MKLKKILLTTLLLTLGVATFAQKEERTPAAPSANSEAPPTAPAAPAAPTTPTLQEPADPAHRTTEAAIGQDPEKPAPPRRPSAIIGSKRFDPIGIVAIFAVFGMPVAIVGLTLYFRHRRAKMLHETLRAMIDKGMPIPAEMLSLDSPAKPIISRRSGDLRGGLILIGIGIGVVIFIGKVGYVPLFMGVAMVIASRIEKHASSAEQNSEQLPQ